MYPPRITHLLQSSNECSIAAALAKGHELSMKTATARIQSCSCSQAALSASWRFGPLLTFHTVFLKDDVNMFCECIIACLRPNLCTFLNQCLCDSCGLHGIPAVR